MLQSFDDPCEECSHRVGSGISSLHDIVAIVDIVFCIVVVHLIGCHGHAEDRNVGMTGCYDFRDGGHTHCIAPMRL